MATLFRADRPGDGFWDWYAVRKARCTEQIWQVARAGLDHQDHAVLELGLLTREARLGMEARARAARFFCCWHILDAPEDVRWQRVRERNALRTDTHVMDVPRDLFDLASRLWEPIRAGELRGAVVEVADSRIPPPLRKVLPIRGPRRLRASELSEAAELCLRSKGHWGYDDDVLESCRPALTITQEELRSDRAVVLADADGLVGLAHIAQDGETCRLDKLFVHPRRIGWGLGARLFRWAVETAEALDARRITVVSDPGAVAFYRRLGCRDAGTELSDVDPGRMLVKLTYALGHAQE
jgi:GNAT superfamily N-acetyltransferase